MRTSKRIGTAKTTILFALILVLAMPLVSFAQGRGRGRGRGLSNLDKCGKFVNCHDARDGRWDGRGPRGSQIGRRNRNDDIFFPGRRVRRVHRVDRDGDGDFDRFDVLLGRRQNRIRRNSRLYR
jgi:hypothetical protein